MAPPSADVDLASSPEQTELLEKLEITTFKSTTSPFPKPLKYSGSLDEYESFDVTSVIGREFPKLQLSEILEDDAKIRDLAITGDKKFSLASRVHRLMDAVSQRGVVFFRKQDLTNKRLKTLAQRLGELSGKPKEAGVSCPEI